MLTSTSIPKAYEKSFDSWVEQKKDAVRLISALGKLLYDKGVELVLFRNPLIDVSPTEILHLHDYAEKFVKLPIQVKDTANLAEGLLKLKLIPSKIDIGKLAAEWTADRQHLFSRKEFLKDKLEAFINYDDKPITQPTDVVLFGFGRIGRLCAREIIKGTGKGQQLRLRAIVTRDTEPEQLQKRVDLLRMDSIHGEFSGVVELKLEDRTMIINGQIVHLIQGSDPAKLDYTQYGIKEALVIDNTGAFRTRKTLEQHLNSKGIDNVLLTAPGEDIPNIILGVNHKALTPEDEKIWATGSCTDNAIIPIIKVLEDTFGLEKGHIQSVHAYTNDQNLLDNMHSKNRRGRSAALNLVVTETDAAIAVEKVIPSLKDKFTANAVRVPTPNGSLAIIAADLKTEVTKELLDSAIKQAALNGDLVEQIKYSLESELVSNDIQGNFCCSVYDSHSTIVAPNRKSVVLYIWYDNESGFTQQVLHLAMYIAKVERPVYF